MGKDRMQRQRFENKYLLSESLAVKIRDFVSGFLELDENGIGKPDFSYPVHSLYLDSNNLATYWMTINGDKNRYKLRLRFYNDSPATPVFFEIKRRMDNCMIKQRGGVFKSAVPQLLAGDLPTPDMLVAQDPKHEFAVCNFLELMRALNAEPKAHVAYEREAWVHPEHDNFRVTFDRRVRVEARAEPVFTTEMIAPKYPFGKEVILELKFTNRYPELFRAVVERFCLMQCGAAKYCEGVAEIGELQLGLQLRHQLTGVTTGGLH
jgi:hypothetical protein